MLVVDGGGVREQGFEVVADGEDVFVAGIVEVHQLADTHAVLCEGEVVWNVDVVEDIFPERQRTYKKQKTEKNSAVRSALIIYR